MSQNKPLEELRPLEAANSRARSFHPDRRVPNFLNESEPATPTRLRRIDPNGPLFAEGSRLAEVTVLEYGGRDRPIITRGGKHLRSRLGSRKTGLQQVTEGRAHRDLAMYDEVNPRVVDYQAHPFKIQFVSKGTRQVYYPDHVRLMDDGLIELIEVKRTPADLHDADYCAKLGEVAEIARRIGWRFAVLYHEDIKGTSWRMRNVEAIYMHRFARLERNEQFAISQFVMDDRPRTWAELRQQVTPTCQRRGDAVLQCCIALRRIAVDLDDEITDETIVTPSNPVRPTNGFRI